MNGVSQGKRSRDPSAFPAMGLVWEVDFAPGENNLRAVGYHNDGTTLDHQITQVYQPTLAGVPRAFDCHVEAATAPDGRQALWVRVQLIDEAQGPVIHTERWVSFVVEAGGRLWANYGVPDGCHIVETANGRVSVFVILDSDSALLYISADSIESTILELNQERETRPS